MFVTLDPHSNGECSYEVLSQDPVTVVSVCRVASKHLKKAIPGYYCVRTQAAAVSRPYSFQ